jgi:hypothetical protein
MKEQEAVRVGNGSPDQGPDSTVRIVTKLQAWTTENFWLDSPQRQGKFSSCKASRGQGVKLTTHLHLMLHLEVSEPTLTPSYMPLWDAQGLYSRAAYTRP